MTSATLSPELMVGMLRKGSNGEQILQILETLVADVNEVEYTREWVCEQLGIADCPENDDEIEAYLADM
jgi:hypothetical protein